MCRDGTTDELTLELVRSREHENIDPAGTAPADQAAFDELVADQRLMPRASSGFGATVVFVPPGNFRQGSGGTQRIGTYAYMQHGRVLGDGRAHP